MTTATATRNVCIKGEDGNLYIIPETMEQKFISLKEAIIETMSGSDEWFDANDEFVAAFGSYEVA
jgi:dTDP-D-glucose 4,6-dehydratase